MEGGGAAQRGCVRMRRLVRLRGVAEEASNGRGNRSVVLRLRKIAMEILVIAGVVVVWLALQLWILPALGVPT